MRTVYRHVEILRAHGFEAFVVHTEPGYRYPFAPSTAPILAEKPALPLRQGDCLVLPENFPLENLPKVPGLRTFVFLQSWSLIFQGVSAPAVWERLPLDGALCASPLLLDFAREFMRCPDPKLTPAAVAPIFAPRLKRLQIACMPRRMPVETALIRDLFHLRWPALRRVPWLEIDAVSQEKVAQTLSESAIFLATGRMEGLGLPVLEALASGCLVVGFHGYGGRDYARLDTGLWCQQEDLPECARLLGRAVALIGDDGPATRAMIRAGQEAAAQYSEARQEEAVLRAWREWTAP